MIATDEIVTPLLSSLLCAAVGLAAARCLARPDSGVAGEGVCTVHGGNCTAPHGITVHCARCDITCNVRRRPDAAVEPVRPAEPEEPEEPAEPEEPEEPEEPADSTESECEVIDAVITS